MSPLTSGKFRIISQLRQVPFFCNWIPDFCLVTIDSSFATSQFDGNKSFVLRSALKGEGKQTLSSGRSISIKGIKTKSDFDRALDTLRQQPDVEEIILQTEELVTHHYTTFIGRDFSYCEETFVKNGARVLISQQFQSGFLVHQLEFEKLHKTLSLNKMDNVLVEWGVRQDKIFVFQITTLIPSKIRSYTESRMVAALYGTFLNWQSKKNIYTLLKEEWTAYRLRKRYLKLNEVDLSHLLENWQCLLHYYYLYCLQQKKSSSAVTWIHFLNATSQKSALGSFAKIHIKIANHFSKKLGMPTPGQFKEGSLQPVYLGYGLWQGKTSDCLFVENLDANIVYSNKSHTVIFTRDSKVLSHGFLAAAETQTKVVANLDQNTWSSLQNVSYVNIDFEHNFINYG